MFFFSWLGQVLLGLPSYLSTYHCDTHSRLHCSSYHLPLEPKLWQEQCRVMFSYQYKILIVDYHFCKIQIFFFILSLFSQFIRTTAFWMTVVQLYCHLQASLKISFLSHTNSTLEGGGEGGGVEAGIMDVVWNNTLSMCGNHHTNLKFCFVIRLETLLLIPYHLFVNHVLLG
jgi:hypothetical protein